MLKRDFTHLILIWYCGECLNRSVKCTFLYSRTDQSNKHDQLKNKSTDQSHHTEVQIYL